MKESTRRTSQAVSRDVRQAMPCSTVARRILKPSLAECLPCVKVLMTMLILPFLIIWMMSELRSWTLPTTSASMPIDWMALAVPSVAQISKPSSAKALASCFISSLSLSATVKRMHPFVGTWMPEPMMAL